MTYIDQYKRRLNAQGATSGEAYVNATISVINDSFSNAPNFRTLKIDGVDVDCRVLEDKTSTQDAKVISLLKTLLFRPNTVINRGAYVTMDGDWIVVDSASGLSARSNIQKCTNTLKWVDDAGATKSYPAFIQNKSLYTTGVEGNRFITTPDSKLNGTIPFNADTAKLTRDKRFLLGYGGKLYAYKITLLDVVTLPGLILLVMEEDMVGPNDNLSLGIADYIVSTPTSPPVGALVVKINGDTTVRATLTTSFTSTVYADGVVVVKNVTWSIVNTDGSATPYATITAQTGTGCTISAGNYVGKYVTLKATLVEDTNITAEVQVRISSLY